MNHLTTAARSVSTINKSGVGCLHVQTSLNAEQTFWQVAIRTANFVLNHTPDPPVTQRCRSLLNQASIQIMLSLLDRGVGVGYAVSGCGLSTWPPPGLLIIHL